MGRFLRGSSAGRKGATTSHRYGIERLPETNIQGTCTVGTETPYLLIEFIHDNANFKTDRIRFALTFMRIDEGFFDMVN